MQGKNVKPVLMTMLVLLGLAVVRKTLLVSKHLVSDAFFLVGVVSLLLWGFVVVKNSRFFDIVGFSFRRFTEVVLNRPSKSEKHGGSYAAYCLQPRPKQESRGLFRLGAICMLLALFAVMLQW